MFKPGEFSHIHGVETRSTHSESYPNVCLLRDAFSGPRFSERSVPVPAVSKTSNGYTDSLRPS